MASERNGTTCLWAVILAVVAACGPTTAHVQADASSPPPAATAATPDASEGLVDEVAALIRARDYDALDAMGARLVATQARTSSGLLKAGLFYSSIHWYLLNGVGGRCSPDAQGVADAWFAARPKSPPAILAVAYAHLSTAWCARGQDGASKVPEEAWPIFYREARAAGEVLANNRSAAVAPAWYAAMEDVAIAENWPDDAFARLHAEAVQRFPWSYDIYFRAARHYQAQWGGSKTAFDAFARRSAAASKATDGAGLYARIYWAAYDGCLETLTRCTAVDMPMLADSMADIAARYPSSWNDSNFAWILCANNAADKARPYFERLPADSPGDPWPNQSTFDWCRQMSGADGVKPVP